MTLSSALKFLSEAVQLGAKGQTVRNDMIARANDMVSAISSVAVFSTMRLNQALMAADRTEKLRKLSDLSRDEIQSFAGMNRLCDQIYSSANAMRHWSSNEWANTNFGSIADAKSLFETLSYGEGGMQMLFSEMMKLPQDVEKKTDTELNDWIRHTINQMVAISTQANSVMAQLSNAI